MFPPSSAFLTCLLCPSRLSQSAELSFPCYSAGPHSLLDAGMRTSISPNLPVHPSPTPVSTCLFSSYVSLSLLYK